VAIAAIREDYHAIGKVRVKLRKRKDCTISVGSIGHDVKLQLWSAQTFAQRRTGPSEEFRDRNSFVRREAAFLASNRQTPTGHFRAIASPQNQRLFGLHRNAKRRLCSRRFLLGKRCEGITDRGDDNESYRRK